MSTMDIQQDIVENEYLKNKNLKKEDVKSLQEWIDRQPHLPKIHELLIIIFLHRCKYSNEKSKQRIDSYLTLRTMMPEIYYYRNPIDFSITNIIKNTILPKTTSEGYRVYYSTALECDFGEYNIVQNYKLIDQLVLLDMCQQGSCDGYIYVSDFEHVSLRHFLDTDITRLTRCIKYMLSAIPVRMNGYHIINPSAFTKRIIGLYKQFLSEKMVTNIHIHENLNTLYKYVPKECLPKECGGELGPIDEYFDSTIKNLAANTDIIVNHGLLLVDESKRPGKPKDANDTFGADGTFKNINFD